MPKFLIQFSGSFKLEQILLEILETDLTLLGGIQGGRGKKRTDTAVKIVPPAPLPNPKLPLKIQDVVYPKNNFVF
jgi:hypothetical protein